MMTTIYPYPGADQPETYEWENRIADPDQQIEAFMENICPISGSILVDIGCGGGFHAARFAATAEHVFGVEPAPAMLQQAYQRFAKLESGNVSLIAAGAEAIPLKNGVADVIHSRFAYFFGPETAYTLSCVPGIQEAQRLLKPEGAFFVIDNNLTSGEFAALLRRFGYGADYDVSLRDAFWHSQGFRQKTIASEWRAPSREVLQRVLAMEFPSADITAMMGELSGTALSYHYDVFYYLA